MEEQYRRTMILELLRRNDLTYRFHNHQLSLDIPDELRLRTNSCLKVLDRSDDDLINQLQGLI